jgi:hypothetical protein
LREINQQVQLAWAPAADDDDDLIATIQESINNIHMANNAN